ncbi:CPBP family intramembrane metalloprotease [Gracilibacillus caseinilyticus]|uniref:CPBP family intramembrane metalloprotease n=1 Tax=Gracilibacillus caseinilyticus TaxID=2932256 RepID=A0ABY4EZ75_9BACI|nr:type II CAAX endopeptidase family protein [Gracilibacillus caseinilyticus]UOQ49705.1 CPBP family intramembrane metalloprotease [Gracilibacillus caseinilyticus]
MADTLWRKLIALLIFSTFFLVLVVDYGWLIGLWALAAGACFFDKVMRGFAIMVVSFGLAFYLYHAIHVHLLADISIAEVRILLQRLSLIVVILVMVVVTRPLMNFWKRPQWQASVRVPLIWAGFRDTSVRSYLFIALLISGLAFLLPFILQQNGSFSWEIVGFMLIFSVMNAVLEEIIWRGFLLSHFVVSFGTRWAVLLTSIGFGLQHALLGMSWLSCLAFSIGGFFFGAITINAKSILPAVIWHGFFNVLMVLGGGIL